MPILLFIDTTANLYYIELGGLGKLRLEVYEGEELKMKLRFLFFNFEFNPLEKMGRSAKKDTKASKGRRMNISFKTALRILKSFTIKRIKINIDTGNYILNAHLFPLFLILKPKVEGLSINFLDKNELLLVIENRPIYIIRSFINL